MIGLGGRGPGCWRSISPLSCLGTVPRAAGYLVIRSAAPMALRQWNGAVGEIHSATPGQLCLQQTLFLHLHYIVELQDAEVSRSGSRWRDLYGIWAGFMKYFKAVLVAGCTSHPC